LNIRNLRREPPGGPVLAHFDADLSPDIRLLDMCLRRNLMGDVSVFPPHGRRSKSAAAILAPALRARLRDLALSKLNSTGGQSPNAEHDSR